MYANLKKRYGQNFLIDKNILIKISNLISKRNQKILEIGPGSGNLTSFILKFHPKELTIIEIDFDLIESLKIKFLPYKNVKIINSDFLKNQLILKNEYDLVISNLPYNISSQVLIKLAITSFRPKKMILMFQKEFADKLLESNLNALNTIISCFYKIDKKFEVSKNSFFPPPKVKSTVLEFNLLKKLLIGDSEINSFIEFKRKIFNKKRKTLKKILRNINLFDISEETGKLRAENLSLNKFIEIYKKTNP